MRWSADIRRAAMLAAFCTIASAVARSQDPSLPPPHPEAVTHGPRSLKRVALTFDACATIRPSRYDERITRILRDTRTPATLFLGGKWMQEHPAATRELASLPFFEIGNHTYLHPHLRGLSEERIRGELQKTQHILDSLTGQRATLFRPPYGEYDARVVRIAAELGLTTIQFDLASGDPDTSATKQRLVDYVVGAARNGSIIVMHINRRGWHTAEALPDIVRGLRKRGFELVTVGALLNSRNEAGF